MENKTNPDLARFVEGALQARVVRMGKPHDYSSGFQWQALTPDGSVHHVWPASAREFQMFTLLCTPQSEWGAVLSKEDGDGR